MFLVLFSEEENPLSRKWGVQNISKSIAPENTGPNSMLNMRSLVLIADNSILMFKKAGSYYITGDEWGMKKRPKYEWSAGKQI